MATRKIGNLVFIFCMICWIQGIYGEWCEEYDYDLWGDSYVSRRFYCTWDCCGISTSRYCCSYSYYDTEWSPVGAIVGGVIGGIIFLGLLITLCVCICNKSKSKPGRVVAPTAGGGPMVIMSQSHQQPSGYSYPPMPQYSYGTGQTGASTNPGISSSSGHDSAVPPPYPYSGASGAAYPPAGGAK